MILYMELLHGNRESLGTRLEQNFEYSYIEHYEYEGFTTVLLCTALYMQLVLTT